MPRVLRAAFERFALEAGRDGAVRYERICRAVAHDDRLLSLLSEAPAPQRRPNILLAAVHYLLLRGADHPLADAYPTVATWRRHGASPPIETPLATPLSTPAVDLHELPTTFTGFCLRHADEIRALVATRSTQTNEIGRCSALYPVLASLSERLAARGGRGHPLALVDLGAAAGLNLSFDRYATTYSPAPLRTCGPPDSPVQLHCVVPHGKDLLPLSAPLLRARIGLDRHPVDLTQRDSVIWLLACQWPDHLDRFCQAQAAIDLALGDPPPPHVVKGDIPGDLPGVVAGVPDDAHLCLFHSWTAAYLSPSDQQRLTATVTALASVRPVSWIYAENPLQVPGLPMPQPPRPSPEDATAVVALDFDRSEGTGGAPCAPVRLADMHSHGRWLRWYGWDHA